MRPGLSPTRPAQSASDAELVVTRVAYDRRDFRKPTDCLAAIRAYVARGWLVTEIGGPATGPFAVVFRKDAALESDGPSGVATAAAHE